MMFLFYFQEAKDRGKHIIAHTVGKAVTVKDAEGASMTLEATPLSDVTLSKDSILFFGKALFIMTSYIRRCIKSVVALKVCFHCLTPIPIHIPLAHWQGSHST